jgi:hypothetical protein
MKKISILIVLLIIWACASSDKHFGIIPTENELVRDCQYLDTISESADPGKLLPNFQKNDAQLKVLQRADRLGATHIVWLYNYKNMGAAAMVYSCDQE